MPLLGSERVHQFPVTVACEPEKSINVNNAQIKSYPGGTALVSKFLQNCYNIVLIIGALIRVISGNP